MHRTTPRGRSKCTLASPMGDTGGKAESIEHNTNLTFARLLLTPDHRIRSYLSESLACLPATPSRVAKASWLQLQLSRGAQTTLLKLRVLASDLASHISERERRGNNEYEESFCPICARSIPKPPDADMFEDLHHLTTSCQQLTLHQTPLHLTVTAEVAKLGGLRLHLASPATTWPNLPTDLQTAQPRSCSLIHHTRGIRPQNMACALPRINTTSHSHSLQSQTGTHCCSLPTNLFFGPRPI